eukprot:6133052-Amphidinium_carterae.1
MVLHASCPSVDPDVAYANPSSMPTLSKMRDCSGNVFLHWRPFLFDTHLLPKVVDLPSMKDEPPFGELYLL